MENSKIKITKQDPNSVDEDFDTHVIMLRGNYDDVIVDEDDIMMDPYWSAVSSPDWNLHPSYYLTEYFKYSSGPSSPFTITSEDEEIKWHIEYDRAVKKHRTDHL